MILNAVYYVSAVVQNVTFMILIWRACGFELTKRKILWAIAALSSPLPQLVFLSSSQQIPPAIRILTILLLMLIKSGCYVALFRISKRKALYLSILSMILNANYTNIMHLFTDDQMFLNIAACILETAVTLLALLYFSRNDRMTAVTHSLTLLTSRMYVIILIFLFFCAFFEHVTVIESLNYISRMLIIPITIAISCIVSRIIRISAKEKEQQRISELLSVQLEKQVEYYQKINSIYTEFRAFRHDFRNHLLCLRGLLAENEVQRACEYMDQIENMSYSKKKNYDTGNIIVDALLNDKNEKAEQYQTQILFTGYVPTSGITSADLCTIFANALDNAIEACAKDSSGAEKQIKVHSDFQQGYFCLNITNPVFEKVDIRNGNQVRTSKEDKDMHGFGVANIVKTAKKYRGEAALSADEQLFTLEVSLWLNPEI